MAVTKEQYGTASFSMLNVVGTMLAGKKSPATYEARVKKLDAKLLQEWRDVLKKLDIQQSPFLTTTLLWIVFQDGLWQGQDWKPGNPRLAIERLKLLTKGAVAKWAQLGNLKSPPDAAANSLVTVDALFIGGKFSTETFEAALPIAHERIPLKQTARNRLRSSLTGLLTRGGALSDDQEERALAIFASSAPNISSADKERQTETLRLGEAIEQNDSGSIERHAIALAKIIGDLIATAAKDEASVYALLTPDQQKLFFPSGTLVQAQSLTGAGPGLFQLSSHERLLALTTDQKTKVAELFADARKAITTIRAGAETQRNFLTEAIKTGDNAGIDRSAAALADFGGQTKTHAAKAEAAFYLMLSSEQRTTYKSAVRQLGILF